MDKSKGVTVNYYLHFTDGDLLSSLPKITIQACMRAESRTQSSSVQCDHHSHSVLITISVCGKVNTRSITLLDFAMLDSV